MLTNTSDTSAQAELFSTLDGGASPIPADRLAGVLAGYRELRRMAQLLRQPRSPASEPAYIFCVAALLASGPSE
jgi:hypothetical protein